ncbi:MAG: hypothetical protein KDA42_00890 [Planctomycetales bacterium]|nr:hypothetical protein [Planctomycetales bacterium]
MKGSFRISWRRLQLVVALLIWAPVTHGEEDKPLPTFETIQACVERHLEAKPAYRQGDLLTQSSAKDIFRLLQKVGWSVPNSKTLLANIPSDGGFLARQMRTAQGEEFMRRISRLPLGYDRVDRLSRLPDGRRAICDLIRGKDGYKLIEYMTTSSGGKNLGKMLSQAPRGTDFNRPTGQIYTAELLIERLRASYDESLALQAKQH